MYFGLAIVAIGVVITRGRLGYREAPAFTPAVAPVPVPLS